MHCFLPILYLQMYFFLKDIQRSNSVRNQSRNFTFTITLNSMFVNATSVNTDTLKPCLLHAQFKTSPPSCRLPSNKTNHWKLDGIQVSKLLERNGGVTAAQSPGLPDLMLWRKTATHGPRRPHSDGFGTTSTRKTMSHSKLWQNSIKCAPMVHLTKDLWHRQFEIMVTYWNRLYCCTHIEYFIICALQIVPRIWLHVLPEAHTAWYFYINVYNCLMLCCESLPH